MPDAWIRQWGDPVLHERAHLVDSFDDVTLDRAEPSERARAVRALTSIAAVPLAA